MQKIVYNPDTRTWKWNSISKTKSLRIPDSIQITFEEIPDYVSNEAENSVSAAFRKLLKSSQGEEIQEPPKPSELIISPAGEMEERTIYIRDDSNQRTLEVHCSPLTGSILRKIHDIPGDIQKKPIPIQYEEISL